MSGFAVKLLASVVIVYISALLFDEVFYPTAASIFVVGAVVALIGQATDGLLLRNGTLWLATALDFAVATVVLYISPSLLEGASVTFIGALYAASFLAIAEYAIHRWLITTGRAGTDTMKAG